MKKQEQQALKKDELELIISQTKHQASFEEVSEKKIHTDRNALKSQDENKIQSSQTLDKLNLSKNEWTEQQELMLIEKHQLIGNKWAFISQFLTSKDDSCVKNHFYSRLRKMIRKLNRIIQIYFKKALKIIPNAAIYKIVEASEQRFKQKPNCSSQISIQSQNVIIKILKISIGDQINFGQSMIIQKERLNEYKQLIQQIYRANKNYKKKSKKIKNSAIKAPLRTKRKKMPNFALLEVDEQYRADQSQILSESEKQESVRTVKHNLTKFQHQFQRLNNKLQKTNTLTKKVQIKEGYEQMKELLKNIGLLNEGIKLEKQKEQKSQFEIQSLKSYSDFQNVSEGLSFLEDSSNCWYKQSKMFTRINKRLFGGNASENDE